MIWFQCTQCKKTHGRSEDMIGTMIFCDCGQGITVPWENTASEPQMPEVVDAPQLPMLEPVRFDAEPVSAPPSKTPPTPPPQLPRSERPRSRPARPPRPKPRRSKRPKLDPNFCLNHETVASEDACSECKERFCKNCLVELEEKIVCGPCKNFRIRSANQPPRNSPLAVISMALGLLTCPLVFCILPIAGDQQTAYFNFLALIPQLFAFVLGMLAIRTIEKDAKTSGRSFAWTGLLSGAFSAALTLIMTLYILSGAAVIM